MIIAPIIHTRTFKCDFNSEFLVRPDKFMDSDIKWARRNVLDATGSIDGLQGVRWLIADNGKYRMAGVVGFLKYICSKCILSKEDERKSEELFLDDKGRLVYAFIGIVIDKLNDTDYKKITYEYLWKLYLKQIYPIWNRTYQEVITEKFLDVEFENVSDGFKMDSVAVGAQELFEANQITDYDLFSDLLCDKRRSNFSFCSNMQDYNLVKQSGFSLITTSQNNITRLKREVIVQGSSAASENISYTSDTMNQNKQDQIPEKKKKSFIILVAGWMIFVIIILMLLLTRKTDLDWSTGRLRLNELIGMNIQNQLEIMV